MKHMPRQRMSKEINEKEGDEVAYAILSFPDKRNYRKYCEIRVNIDVD
ncbi:MAG: hypothetical protein QXZ70_00555 [Candidatus Bathyarchaeia archaeon]